MQSTASAPESSNNMHLARDETDEELSSDEVAIIFSFLQPKDIMRARVCTTWRDAAKKTIVPPVDPTDFPVEIHDPRSYNAVRAMSTALPNLDQLVICDLGGWHVYSDNEDPAWEWDTNHIIHDINIISRFRKLRILTFYEAPLTGRYPDLFDFPLLQELSIACCQNLKFDLDMLRGFPLLEVLDFRDNQHLTGNISSLRAFKGTLKSLYIWKCLKVRGNFMDLADFPHLKELELLDTPVTGDIRDINVHDFPALERLYLPDTVHGGRQYEFQQISEAPTFMHTVYLLLQRTPTLFSKQSIASQQHLIGRSQKTLMIGMRKMKVKFRIPHFTCNLYEPDHVVGGVGVRPDIFLRARSVGLIQSQTVKAVTLELTSKNCKM